MRRTLIAVLACAATALQPAAPLRAATALQPGAILQRRNRVARPSSADGDIGVSLEDMNSPGAAIAKLKKEMDEAQKAGDIDTVVELMGTLLSLEGAYESEAGEDESPPGPCAD